MGKHTNGYHGPSSSNDEDGDEVYDALADLFLSDQPGVSTGRRTPTNRRDREESPDVEGVATLRSAGERSVRRPERPGPGEIRRDHAAREDVAVCLESLVLGHLPVMASAWATQYAQAIVDSEARPVACLRLATGYASLEVYGIGRQLEPAATIDAAIRRAASLTDRWVLRADAPNEPALAMRPEITDVTLLVGADEAAVVAAYRTIKGLVSQKGAMEEEATRKNLRVAVMGAESDKAGVAYAKIAHTVEVYLGQPVERAASAEKVRPAPSATLYRGPIEDESGVLIDQLLDALEDAEGVTDSFEGPVFPRAVEAEPAALASAPAIEEESTERLTTEPDFADEEYEEQETSAPVRPALSAQLGGLTPLRARCPFEPLVELAFDQDGRLHTLEHSEDATVSSLLTATSWAAQHSELIALTVDAGDRVRPGLAPTMHVFTDRPHEIRRLLDTEVRVHLLRDVEMDGRTAWCCTDLN